MILCGLHSPPSINLVKHTNFPIIFYSVCDTFMLTIKKEKRGNMQYQNIRNAYHNQEKIIFPGEGNWRIPALPAVDFKLNGSPLIRIDQALKDPHPEDHVVHFFTDDYVFERIWRLPERYLPIFASFKAIIAPDFSLYSDHPRACQIFNHFRKHWMGAYYSSMGITVIPCIRWVYDDLSSFDWCLDGEPKESTICISTHGIIKGAERKRLFLAGWERVIQKLQPKRIILFGDTFPGLEYPRGEIEHVPNECMLAKRKYCRRERA